MPPGQPYLLTRGPLPEPGFVYVTIPPDQVDRFRSLPAAARGGAAGDDPGGAHPVSRDAGGGAGLAWCPAWKESRSRMNDLLKQRIARALDGLSDERGYQILDFIEFLDSKYAERSRPGGIFAKVTETVEDTMRAGKLPIQAISGTMGLMDSAAKVMKGLAAAGQAVVDEAVKAAEDAAKPSERSLPARRSESRSCHPERSEAEPAMVPFASFRAIPCALTAQRRGDSWPHRPRRHPRPRRLPPSSSAASARWRRSRSSSAR